MLDKSSYIEAGVGFSLEGTLHNLQGSTLTIEDTAVVDVALQIDGELVLGNSAGEIDVRQL